MHKQLKQAIQEAHTAERGQRASHSQLFLFRPTYTRGIPLWQCGARDQRGEA